MLITNITIQHEFYIRSQAIYHQIEVKIKGNNPNDRELRLDWQETDIQRQHEVEQEHIIISWKSELRIAQKMCQIYKQPMAYVGRACTKHRHKRI